VSEPTAEDFDTVLDAGETSYDAPTQRGSRLDAWWMRATTSSRVRRLYAVGVPVTVTLTAALPRLWNLGYPRELVFDETFYVKDAWSLWNLGYSASWPDGADEGFKNGIVDTFTTAGSFVVHPPLGKWLIGAGMALFGPENAASWRVATAIAGILAVILLFFIAKKLFDSTLLGGIAAGLMAIDGNAIVMSRIALLDNFVMLFALLGFGAMLLDREYSRARIDRWVTERRAAGRNTDWGPVLWWRPWLFAAGLAFGLTSSVKWSGFYFLAAFAVYSVVVDVLARRRAGITFYVSGTIWRQGPASFLLTVPVAAVTLLLSWTSWFTSDGGYDRHWAETAGNAATGILSWVPIEVQSWWHYQVAVYNYNIHESRPHNYQANPLTWLLMLRPTSMYYDTGANCGTDACGASITGLANPLIWWAATAALLYLVYRLVRYREWRVGFILMGMVGGYLPWLLYLNRTVFQFYSIAFEPYMLLALTFVIGIVLGKKSDPPWRRENGIRFVGIFLALAIALSVFFWPLWTGQSIDYTFLRAHWWLLSWI
jgi:dolichyl-phosphate-mannose--protein O-mannosyl transferase